MKFGYTIVYVSSVTETLAFYKEAFGFETRFLHESNQYGELETGATVLAFASHATGEMNLDGNYQKTPSPPEGPRHPAVAGPGAAGVGSRPRTPRGRNLR